MIEQSDEFPCLPANELLAVAEQLTSEQIDALSSYNLGGVGCMAWDEAAGRTEDPRFNTDLLSRVKRYDGLVNRVAADWPERSRATLGAVVRCMVVFVLTDKSQWSLYSAEHRNRALQAWEDTVGVWAPDELETAGTK